MSANDVIEVAKKFVAEVDREYPVREAYLFGSFAKGKADEASDIDICVVSDVFGKDYFDEESRLRHISLRVDDRISPVAYNPEDFNDKWSQLASEIVKYGVRIGV